MVGWIKVDRTMDQDNPEISRVPRCALSIFQQMPLRHPCLGKIEQSVPQENWTTTTSDDGVPLLHFLLTLLWDQLNCYLIMWLKSRDLSRYCHIKCRMKSYMRLKIFVIAIVVWSLWVLAYLLTNISMAEAAKSICGSSIRVTFSTFDNLTTWKTLTTRLWHLFSIVLFHVCYL